MFSIVAEPTFACPVLLSRPASDTPVRVSFTFKHKNARDFNAWVGQAAAYADDAAFLGEVIDSWGPEITGPDDKPMPYSQTALATLFDRFPKAAAEVMAAYRERLRDARRGN